MVVGGIGEWFGGRGRGGTKYTLASRPVPEGEGGFQLRKTRGSVLQGPAEFEAKESGLDKA